VKESRQQVAFAKDVEGLTTSIVDDVTVAEGVSFVVGRQIESVTQDPLGLLAQLVAGLPTDASAADTGIRAVGEVKWAISQLKLNAPDSAQEVTGYVAATYQNGSAYTVLAAAPSSDWDNLSPVFQQMIDSFQFTGPPAAAVIAPTPTTLAALTITATAAPTRLTPTAPVATPIPTS
jgi:hypothetical protein